MVARQRRSVVLAGDQVGPLAGRPDGHARGDRSVTATSVGTGGASSVAGAGDDSPSRSTSQPGLERPGAGRRQPQRAAAAADGQGLAGGQVADGAVQRAWSGAPSTVASSTHPAGAACRGPRDAGATRRTSLTRTWPPSPTTLSMVSRSRRTLVAGKSTSSSPA